MGVIQRKIDNFFCFKILKNYKLIVRYLMFKIRKKNAGKKSEKNNFTNIYFIWSIHFKLYTPYYIYSVL